MQIGGAPQDDGQLVAAPAPPSSPPFKGSPRSHSYQRHSLPVRIMHWVNFVALAIMLMSGLQIFNAYPVLNWGQSSYSQTPPLLVLAHGFPSWITLPSGRWLAMGRRWHLFFAWIFVINGLAYVIYTIASRHLHRDLTSLASCRSWFSWAGRSRRALIPSFPDGWTFSAAANPHAPCTS